LTKRPVALIRRTGDGSTILADKLLGADDTHQAGYGPREESQSRCMILSEAAEHLLDVEKNEDNEEYAESVQEWYSGQGRYNDKGDLEVRPTCLEPLSSKYYVVVVRTSGRPGLDVCEDKETKNSGRRTMQHIETELPPEESVLANAGVFFENSAKERREGSGQVVEPAELKYNDGVIQIQGLACSLDEGRDEEGTTGCEYGSRIQLDVVGQTSLEVDIVAISRQQGDANG